MKPGLAKILSATAVAAIAFAPSLAEARHRRGVGFGAHAHVHGGISVGIGVPVVVQPAPVYAYPDYYYPPQPAPPPPPQAYYPPPAQPAYYPPPAPAPERRPVLGLGVLFSSIDVEDGALEGAGVGLIGRIRFAPSWQLELQLSQDQFKDNPRIDTRIGGALIYELGQPGGFSPYILIGLGANVISPLGEINDENEDNDEELPHQGYIEAGLGAAFEIGRHFELSGDVRLQSRHLAEDEDGNPRSFPGSENTMPDGDQEENAAEARLNLIYWF